MLDYIQGTVVIVFEMIKTSGSIENQNAENMFWVIAICLAGINVVVFWL